MTIPNVRATQVDGNLGATPQATDQITCVMGYASLAAPNTLLAYSDVNKLAAECGKGPGVEACAEQIADSGVGYLISPTCSVAGVAGSVTETGTSPAITVTGAPNDLYRVRVVVTKAGAIGTSEVTISLDGGNTVPPPVVSAATIALTGTGLTLAMAAGTYNVGDTASFDCEAPYPSPANVTTAGAALLLDPREFGTLLIAGRAHGADDAAKAGACELVAAAATTFAALARTKSRYFNVVIDGPLATAASMKAAFASFVDDAILVTAMHEDVMSPITALVHKRPIGGTYCGRIAKIAVHKHPGEVRTDQKGGALPARVKALYGGDDDNVTDLDAARFVTFRALIGETGFFVTRGPTMAGVGSDYSEHQYCRVANLGSKVTRNGLNKWLNTDLVTKRDGSGQLSDMQAEVIDADLTKRVRAALVDTKYVVDAFATSVRTNDVLTTSTLQGKTGILRKGYAEFITWDVGFTRSA